MDTRLRNTCTRRTAWLLICCAAAISNAATHYVNVNNTSPVAPYTNWVTAAAVIQDAVDAAAPGDDVIVTNGVYQSGGAVGWDGTFTRVLLTKAARILSVNGPSVTVIDGGHSNRCVFLEVGGQISGFTLS